MSKEEMIAAIKSCAEQLGRAPSTRELHEMTNGKCARNKVSQKFGTYTRALELSGLAREDKARPHSKMEQFLAWAALARKLGKVPTGGEFRQQDAVSQHCLLRQFGKWTLVPAGMLRLIEKEKLEGEWGDVAAIIREHATAPARVLPSALTAGMSTEAGQTAMRMAMPMREFAVDLPPLVANRPLYGEPILSPVMAHAPTNELGVMVLFGALAHDLGFKIMRVQAAFPDCEAMRRMANGRCQLQLIEFEFESRNFVDHVHDVNGCDLIVCWLHNWKESPLEVIELSRIVGAARVIG